MENYPHAGRKDSVNPLRIVLFPSSYLPALGGLEIFVYDLAKEFIDRDIQVIIINGRLETLTAKIELAHDNRIPLYHTPCPGIIDTPESDIEQCFLQLRQVFKEFSPNIVNVQYLGLQSYYALKLKEEFGYKLIISTQGSDLNNYDVRSRARKRLIDSCLSIADAVTGCSDSLIETAIKIAPTCKSHIYRIFNGTRLDLGSEVGEFEEDNHFILGIGRLVPVKGFDILVRAFASVVDRLNSNLVIAGDGVEKENLENLAIELGIHERVKFLGSVSRSQVVSLLKKSKYLVIPSRNEGLSITAIEATMTGCAVIASNVGGLPDVIENGVNGLLFEKENISDLGQKMCLFENDPSLRRFLEKNGLERSKTFSIEATADEYISLFQKLLFL